MERFFSSSTAVARSARRAWSGRKKYERMPLSVDRLLSHVEMEIFIDTWR
jgi:hypothetical protein